jgi:hypothetical protein
MHLVTNSVDSDRVREVTENGTRYFEIDDVPVLRAQDLAGGYVPEAHVAASTDEWSVPLTLSHPTDDAGRIVSANTDRGEAIATGEATNPTLDEQGRVTPDLRIDADRAEALGDGGEALVAALEDGAGIDVSSQYFADSLPAGVYDGQYRERVEGNLRPDSIALLPDSQGVCTLPDCGIAPDGGSRATANADRERLRVRRDPDGSDADGTATGTDDAGLVRRGLAYLGAAVSRDTATGWAPITANEPNEPDAHDENSTDSEDDDSENSEETTPAESVTDANETTSSDMEPDRDDLIDEITANSNIERSSLDGMGDTCLETTHEHIVGNAEDEAGSETPDDEDDTTDEKTNETDMGDTDNTSGEPDEPTDTVTLPADAVPDAVAAGEKTFGEVIDEAITANQKRASKKGRVDRIVANSAEFDADDHDDLMDTPPSMLDRIEDRIETGAPGLPGSSSAADRATANTQGEDVDTSDFGTGVIGDD